MKKIALIFLYALAGINLAIAQNNSAYQLSTHILDTNLGQPASGVTIHLYKFEENLDQWTHLYEGRTDQSGRIADLMPVENDNTGIYKIRFETSRYYQSNNIKSIYPYIEVTFIINDKTHYHIPLTMSANGYSTYRGS